VYQIYFILEWHYMLQTTFPSIIRSLRLCIHQQAYVKQTAVSVWLLHVQSWTPDDGRKDRPKHVECNIILNSVRQYNHFITQGNYKATCFEYRLVILRPILSIVSQDSMHTLGTHCVYIHGIHQIKSFVSKGVLPFKCIVSLQIKINLIHWCISLVLL